MADVSNSSADAASPPERSDPGDTVESDMAEFKPVAIKHVRWTGFSPKLRQPTLIAAFEGWNDAGDAASMAARHLAAHWRCRSIAEIDPEPFYDFTTTRPTVHLNSRKIRSLKWPSNELKAARLDDTLADVVVLMGIEPQLRWRTFSEQVIAMAQALGVKRVVTLGALLAEVPHSRPVQVFGTAEDEAMREEFRLAASTYEGPTGIVGVLTAACRDAGYSTASFWSAVPSYMPSAPSPKAALALVDRACAVTGAPVTTFELKRAARTYEHEVAKIVASDDETAEYVAQIEKNWDANQVRQRLTSEGEGQMAGDTRSQLLDGDPATLVAEVERFLRESE